MRHASDEMTAKMVDLPLAADIRRAIAKLASLHDGDVGVIETVACGRRAIPALRTVLFSREPSGLYETRRRAVEALARLRAYDVLIDYLDAPPDAPDPVEHTGDEAVINAAARELPGSLDARVVPVLLRRLVRDKPLAGVVEALGELRCREALPYFIEALSEDFTRSAAEAAIRKLGHRAREALLEATRRGPSGEPETVSSRRQRRSALELLAELGPPRRAEWPRLHCLKRDADPNIAAIACQMCLASPGIPGKVAAARRLLDLLFSADWLLSEKIEDTLVRHFDVAKPIIEEALRHGGVATDPRSPGARAMQALHRITVRAASDSPRIRS